MSKKNNKTNKQYNQQNKIIDENNVGLFEEVATEVSEMNEYEVDSETVESTVEEDMVVDTAPDKIESGVDITDDNEVEITKNKTDLDLSITEDTSTDIAISEPRKNVNSNGTTSISFKIVFVENGSPLQISKIIKRLKSHSINYEYDRTSETISGQVFSSRTEAIASKKYFAGIGLKPTIKVIKNN